MSGITTIPTAEASLNERLGYDVRFPIVGNFESIAGLNTLLQDIQQLLLTTPGERLNRPNYGCNLRKQVWENIDTAASQGVASIKTALSTYENRITVTNVRVKNINRNTGLISFAIRFVVKNTDTEVNLVFPFRASTDLSFA